MKNDLLYMLNIFRQIGEIIYSAIPALFVINLILYIILAQRFGDTTPW